MIAASLQKYRETNAVPAAYALAAGYVAWSVLRDTYKAWVCGQSVDGDRHTYDGVEITPYGTGANNSTFVCKVWRVLRERTGGGVARDADLCLVDLLLSATCTLGTKAGHASGLVGAGEVFADTVVLDVKPALIAAYETARGRISTASSPADNTIGKICLADLCDAFAIVIEVGTGTATGANFLLCPSRGQALGPGSGIIT